MIFCRKCGRYYSDGTPSCSACGANLKEFGHVSFQGTTIKIATASGSLSIAPPRQPIATLSGSEPPVASGDTDPVFDRDKFLLRQKTLAIKEKYYVTDDSGAPLMFVERPAMLVKQLIMCWLEWLQHFSAALSSCRLCRAWWVLCLAKASAECSRLSDFLRSSR